MDGKASEESYREVRSRNRRAQGAERHRGDRHSGGTRGGAGRTRDHRFEGNTAEEAPRHSHANGINSSLT
jgi:hypothetical protein